MTPENERRAGLLLAAWPGMGSVALLVAGYLVEHLDGEEVEIMPTGRFFPPRGIDIEDGLITGSSGPGCRLFRCHGALPDASDMLVFLGEAQPDNDGYQLCQEVVARACAHGVRRCVTCAAMAGLHRPGTTPRVLAAATDRPLLEAARAAGATPLADGRISGLNGLLLPVAQEHGCEGLCLLGEMPFYATGVPNPSAALACLQCLMELSGLVVALDQLAAQADDVDRRLAAAVDHLDLLRSIGRTEEARASKAVESPADALPPEPDLSLRERIDALFAAAATERDRVIELKHLLDRHGLFERYEDRFLDLFKKTN